MLRFFSVVAIAVAGILFAAPTRAAQDTGLKVGEKFEGEVKEKKRYGPWGNPGNGSDVVQGFAVDIPIELKAGQKISITATVIGSDRKVWTALLDPSGKIVARTDRQKPGIKTIQLMIPEVNATGTYKIAVISDQIGAFTLKATGLTEDQLDEKALEEQIKQLEKDLQEARAKLKALKAKK